MADLFQQRLNEALELHKSGKLEDAEKIYHKLLGLKFDNPLLLYLLGDVYARLGKNGVAINLFWACLTGAPEFQEALIDLGVALKREHHEDMARKAWEKALSIRPSKEIFVNLATLTADSGGPDEALALLDQALATDPEDRDANWNRALALLAKADWERAWEPHEYRRRLDKWSPRTKHGLDDWDGSPGKRILVHGEQGLGDEIMYLSCLPDLMPLASRITVECEPRLIPLVRRSFGVEAFGSEEETPDLGYDCQIPLGTLPKFFRRTPESFPGKPYLKPDPEKVAKFRDRLHRLGPRPWIGLGWYGGVKATRPHERSLPLWKLLPVMAGRTCVSVQYGNTSIREAEEVDLPILDESLGLDLDAQAALIAACDIIVTVPQTAVHVAGALGVPTLVLTPVRCSWRYGYGLSGQNEVMPWYGSVRLLRQPAKDAWEAVVDRAAEAIEGVEREMLRRAA